MGSALSVHAGAGIGFLGWKRRSWSAGKFNLMQIGIAFLTCVMLGWLINTVPEGLLGTLDMGIRGYGSRDNQLNWFADRSVAALPSVSIISLPVWLYRLSCWPGHCGWLSPCCSG
jgi:hypothetical protein